MLTILTHYLFRYKRVTLPHVGTLKLVQQPAGLRVADKQIDPPGYAIELTDEEEVAPHQLLFVSNSLGKKRDESATDLDIFGKEAGEKINTTGFDWPGLSVITSSSKKFPLASTALTPIVAERVLRQDAEHSVLQGDKQLTSSQITGERTEVEIERKPYPLMMIAGWIILALALLAIVFILYNGGFKAGSAGSKLPAASIVVTHRSIL